MQVKKKYIQIILNKGEYEKVRKQAVKKDQSVTAYCKALIESRAK